VEYAVPELRPPYRVLVLVAATDGWYEADASERWRILDEFGDLLGEMTRRGARLVGSFDDDLFLTGQPAPLPYTIFLLYDVDDLDAVVQLVHALRSSRLARFLRLEARIGRMLFLLDR
jgi:chlorite dismutase